MKFESIFDALNTHIEELHRTISIKNYRIELLEKDNERLGNLLHERTDGEGDE